MNFAAKTQDGKSFLSNFRQIDFNTLKHRHDNFAFSKAIATKIKQFDAIHFQKMDQGKPQLMIFHKEEP